MLVAVVNIEIVFPVPPVVVTLGAIGGGANDGGEDELAVDASVALAAPLAGGGANTKADGGSPPTVCASAAFSA